MKTISFVYLFVHSIFPVHSVVPYASTNDRESYDWAGGFSFFLPLIVALIYLGYRHLENRKWMDGVFPADLAYTKTNLMEAYMCLAAYFITIDRFHQMQKVTRLRSFFIRYFKQAPDQYEEIIERNFHYPIHPGSVVDWLNKHSNEHQKKELLRFFVGFCHLDGTLNEREYNTLKFITLKLRIEIEFLDSLIFSHRENRSESNTNREQRSSHRRSNPQPQSISIRKKYADVLGISENAGEKEIRQRYRQLVKRYHPDKYARDSKEKQEQAHQRFLEIQEAYEHLLKG